MTERLALLIWAATPAHPELCVTPLVHALAARALDAEERPKLVNNQPYTAGWMARARPTRWESEKSTLIDAASYRQHILKIEPEASFD